MNASDRGAGRLLLIDGHSMAFRAFFALPVDNFTTGTGQHTNAVHGFLSMLLKLIAEEKPTHVAVAFDEGSHTFRTDEYDQYKGGRDETPEAFLGQVPLIREMLSAAGLAELSRENFEADDILATLATQGAAQGLEVLVASGDRDTFQLVTEDVTVLYPVKGVSTLARMTPAAVLEKYKVPPARYPELAALTGETADNLPGVPGVGPGFAAKWLNEYDGLDNVIARAGEITGKKGEALRAHLDDVLRNRRLNHLLTDMDLPVGPADLTPRGGDRAEVRRLCDTLEFNTLRDRLVALVPADGGGDDEGADAAPTAPEREVVDDVAAWLAEAAGPAAGPIAIDVETEGGRAVGLGLADGTRVAHVDLDDAGPHARAVAAWLASDAPTVAHDAKAAWHALRAAGLELAGIDFDTQLASYLAFPGQRTYDLREMLARLLGREMDTDAAAGDAQGVLDLEPDTGRASRERAAAVDDLARRLRPELVERGADALMADVELPVQRSLQRMEATGIAVDEEHLAALEAEFGRRVTEAADAAYAQIDGEINLSSPKQLQEVLFERLGMPRTKRTKTGYTTDAEALAELLAKTGHPFLEHLLVHREQIKLRQIVETLRKTVRDDGRIHTTFQQTIAATGRLSSLDPNLQNIPIRTDEGQRIREAFVASADFETLLTADYSQIEMRIMAHLSGDAGLIEAFHAGEDLHRFVGSRVFEVAPADVTPAMRSKVKAMSYGLAYGLSAFGLSRQLGVEVAEARGLMDGYFERFGGVKTYLRGVVDQARTTGYTETIMGRRRYLPDLTSDNRQRREMAERIALNAPIQGSAADIIKVAMIRVDDRLAAEGLRSRMQLQVHDELVLEVAPGESAAVTAVLTEEMSGAAELSVPLDVSVGTGPNWRVAGH